MFLILFQVRETAFASIKVLLLKKYLNESRIEELVCPTSVQLLNLEGLPEDVVRERHPDAFVVRTIYPLFCPFLHFLLVNFLVCSVIKSFEMIILFPIYVQLFRI